MPDTAADSGAFLSLDDVHFPETLEPAEVARVIAVELRLKPTQTLATLTLLDDGNTVPFIARYRKEATGNLDEVEIQADQRPRRRAARAPRPQARRACD